MNGATITPTFSGKTAIMFDGLIDMDDEEQDDEPGNNNENEFRDMAIEEIARFDRIQHFHLFILMALT